MFSVYPRVKVRDQEQYDDQFEFGKRSLQSLKVPGFLSSNEFSSPDNSPTSVVRVPQSDSFNPGAVHNRQRKILEENSTSIRASPVLRPRAVLSSPDNDQLLGSKNRARGGSLSSTKKDSSFPNRHTKCKVIPGPIGGVAADVPVNTKRELKEVAVSRNVLQSSQRTITTTDPSQKANIRKGSAKPLPG